MDSLKKSSEEKEKLIQLIKAGKTPKADAEGEGESTEDKPEIEEDRELSEWEKRLEGMS
jgi:hypothetical protein